MLKLFEALWEGNFQPRIKVEELHKAYKRQHGKAANVFYAIALNKLQDISQVRVKISALVRGSL